jgi:TRAP-type C4-dicarboxylate transport system substrate-binding protein
METKRAIKRFSMLTLTVLFVVGLWSPVQAQVAWKFQSLLNPGHMTPDAEIWMSKEIEKRTDGKFKIEVFTGAALGFAGPRNLITVGQGVLDSAEIWAPHVSGDFRMLEIAVLHELIPFDVPLRKEIINEIFPTQEKLLRERFNVKGFWQVQVEPRNIYTKKPVKRLSDLKGMKIRSEGILENEFTKAIGATPLTLAWGDIYTSLQQGVIDGYWVTHSGTFNAKFYEHAKYCLELNTGGSTTLFIANLDKFNKLPPDFQKILIEVSQQAANMMWDRVVPDVESFKKQLQGVGMTFYAPHPDDAKLTKKVGPKIWDMWLEKAEPGTKEMLSKIKARVAAWEKKKS